MKVTDDVLRMNAVEAAKAHKRQAIARVRGQMDASAALAGMMARLNQDTLLQRQGLEEELRQLDDSPGLLDDFGRFSALDEALFTERAAGKAAGYDWLVENPHAEESAVVAVVEGAMSSAREALGRPWPLQHAAGLLREWRANAHARGLCPEDTWESFRESLLRAGRDASVRPLG